MVSIASPLDALRPKPVEPSEAELMTVRGNRENASDDQPVPDLMLSWKRGEVFDHAEAIRRVKITNRIQPWDNASAEAHLSLLAMAGWLVHLGGDQHGSFQRPMTDPTPHVEDKTIGPSQSYEWVPAHTAMKFVELPSGDVIQVPVEIAETYRDRLTGEIVDRPPGMF